MLLYLAALLARVFAINRPYVFAQVYTVSHHTSGSEEARLDVTLNYDVSL